MRTLEELNPNGGSQNLDVLPAIRATGRCPNYILTTRALHLSKHLLKPA